jgi:RHS repeat-associated protein
VTRLQSDSGVLKTPQLRPPQRVARLACLVYLLGLLSGIVPVPISALADTGATLTPSYPAPMATVPSASTPLSSLPAANPAVAPPVSTSPAPVDPLNTNGWSKMTSATTVPSWRHLAAVAYDPATAQVVLYGGWDGEWSHGDTWIFNGQTWSQSSAVEPCGPLDSAGMTYDTAHGNIVMFGGNDQNSANCGPTNGLQQDTLLWNGSAWSEALPAVKPSLRRAPLLAYDSALGKVVMFGGWCAGPPGQPGDYCTDTWTWDGTNWAQINTPASPPPLAKQAGTYDAASGHIVFYGQPTSPTGGDSSHNLFETWTFDGTTWTEQHSLISPSTYTASTELIASPTVSMAYDPDVAASVYDDAEAGETWLWNGLANEWILEGVNQGPGGTLGPMVYDAALHDVVAADTSSTWTWGPPKAPLLSKAVDRGANGVYSRGELVTYTLLLGTPGVQQVKSPITVTDSLPPTLVPVPGSTTFNGSACSSTTAPACVFNGQTLSVTGVDDIPNDVQMVTYQAIALGSDAVCLTVTNAASASDAAGASSGSIPIVVCDTGLGLENWWSYEKTALGPQAAASVNVANGNLVINQTDGTPIQAHGHLAFVLRRYYNSQDLPTVVLPGSLGAGWQFNVDAGDDLGPGLTPSALAVPAVQSVLTPMALTLVDRTGTRHLFTPRAVALNIDVTNAVTSLGALQPHALQVGAGYDTVTVDQTFDAPPGVHLGLWRYVESSSTCSTCPHLVLGFAAERPDRVRYEFTADGRMVDMIDGNGVELRYTYETAIAAGQIFPRLLSVYEPRSCTPPLTATCRSFQFSYPNTTTTTVADPAGRATTYHFDTASPYHLTSIDNPDGSHNVYTYGGCGGSTNQLCSASDPRGDATHFTYAAAPLGPARIATVVDRDGNTISIAYTVTSGFPTTTATRASEQRIYNAIDGAGRVTELDAGSTNGSTALQSTLFAWDASGATCTQPVPIVDNDLCTVTRRALTPATADNVTSYLYNQEGQTLRGRTAVGATSLDTTFGFHAQYFEATGPPRTFEDSVAGAGLVASTGPGTGTGRIDPETVFAISDRTQQLTPRGNAAGSAYAQFLTTYLVDDNDTVNPNAIASPGGTCSDPANPTANTGNVCQITAPLSGSNPAITRYTYDTYGQKATMTTPKALAEGGTAPPSYTYTYYQDSDLDLSGSMSAGGWLKAVTDPYGRFALFAYDRAGNVARSYERNATAGHAVTDLLSSYGSAYTQTLHGSGTTALSAPWRYLLSQTDPLGNVTTYTVDANGNQTAIRPPRGTYSNVSTYDITQSFDANDNLLTQQTPAEAGKPTKYTYDQYGSRSSMTDPNGNVRAYQYDSVNRLSATVWTRGSWSGSGPVPSACHDSTSADSPIPAGLITCSTTSSYDGEDNAIASQDGNHQTTTYTYDAAHRKQTQLVPRNDGTYTTVETAWVYDADGNITDLCPPNQFTLPAAVCNTSSIYGTHSTYDAAGHRLTVTTFRAAGGAANTTTTNYDADSNPVQVADPNGHTTNRTYDYTDRRLTEAVQRDAATSETTTWQFDPSGNVTAVTKPAGQVTAYSYDADNRPVDTVAGASSTVASQAGVASTDGGSNVRTRLFYDQDGHVVAVFDPGAFTSSVTSPDASFMSRRDYDPDGRPIAEYVPRYDSAGHSDLGLSSTQTTQCPTGVAPQQSVPNVPPWPSGVGVCTTKLQYDADGNSIQMTLPTSNGSDNRYINYAYTNDNLLSTVCTPNPSGAATTCAGSTASPRIVAQTNFYDADAKPVETIDALGNASVTAYFSDELAHQQIGQPNGATTHTTTYAYDANGNQIGATDPLGLATTTAYFSDNLVNSQTDPAGDVTSYTYDPSGNRISVMSPSANAHDTNNASGTPTTYTYTFDNLLATVTQPVSPTGSLRRETVYGYDASGRKTSEQIVSTNATGQQVGDGGTQSFAYFSDDRLNTQTSSLGGSITSTYTPTGQPTSIVDTSEGGSTLTATYYLDNGSRTVDDGSRTTQSTYDGLGSPAAQDIVVDGTSTKYVTTYGYGDAELPASMSDTAVTGSGSTAWTYDAAGRLQKETDPNGEAITPTFNHDDTLASLLLTNSGGGTLANWSYLYDADYRITQQQFSGTAASGTPQQSTFCYHYDAASRVDGFQMLSPGSSCGTVPPTITHDHDGNRLAYTDPNTGTATTYTYNADDSIATQQAAGALTPNLFTYTPAGDLVSDGCATNSYDGFYRLTQYQSSGGTSCPATATKTYAYDGLDRQRTSGSMAVHFAGLSSAVALETTSGTDTAYALDPSGQAKAAAVETGSPAAQYLVYDGHGNVTTATSSAQTVSCTARFDPYGSPISAASAVNPCNTGSTVADVFYGGARRDPTTGRYQFGSRTYDPSKADFLAPDSYRTAPSSADLGIGTDPLTENRYNYVNGDPVNLVDPNGHNPCSNDDCTPEENRALAASDRGSDTSGSWKPSARGPKRTFGSRGRRAVTPRLERINDSSGGAAFEGLDAYEIPDREGNFGTGFFSPDNLAGMSGSDVDLGLQAQLNAVNKELFTKDDQMRTTFGAIEVQDPVTGERRVFVMSSRGEGVPAWARKYFPGASVLNDYAGPNPAGKGNIHVEDQMIQLLDDYRGQGRPLYVGAVDLSRAPCSACAPNLRKEFASDFPGEKGGGARGIANSNFISQTGEEAQFQREAGVDRGGIGLRQGYDLNGHLAPMSPNAGFPGYDPASDPYLDPVMTTYLAIQGYYGGFNVR